MHAPAREPSVPTALVTVQPASSPADRFAHALSRAQDAGDRLKASLVTASSVSVVQVKPPSLAEHHARHREAVAHREAAIARWPRRTWGAFHVLLVAVLRGVEWVTETPVRFVLTVAFLASLWFWL